MKTLLAAAVLALFCAAPVSADNKSDAAKWYTLHHECRIGETDAGLNLTDAAITLRCKARDRLTASLRHRGMCWVRSEATWQRCRHK